MTAKPPGNWTGSENRKHTNKIAHRNPAWAAGTSLPTGYSYASVGFDYRSSEGPEAYRFFMMAMPKMPDRICGRPARGRPQVEIFGVGQRLLVAPAGVIRLDRFGRIGGRYVLGDHGLELIADLSRQGRHVVPITGRIVDQFFKQCIPVLGALGCEQRAVNRIASLARHDD